MDLRLENLGRIRTRPEAQFRRVVERAPEAEAALDRVVARFRPAWTQMYARRRRIATSVVILLTLWLSVHIFFGANGMVVYNQRRAEIRMLEQQVEALQQENQVQSGEIKALKSDPKAIEKEAREQLHYARPGEIIYVPPPPLNQQRPTSNAARK
ncbi:MAG TPA: septum formation initiator family protein [Terriglobales bacterium]|jgi:cell division protein FtsB